MVVPLVRILWEEIRLRKLEGRWRLPELDPTLAQAHDIALLLDEEVVQVRLHHGVQVLGVLGQSAACGATALIDHLAESLMDCLQVEDLLLLGLFDLLILVQFFSLLCNSLPHLHYLLNILVFKLNDLREGFLVHTNQVGVLILKGVLGLDLLLLKRIATHRRSHRIQLAIYLWSQKRCMLRLCEGRERRRLESFERLLVLILGE